MAQAAFSGAKIGGAAGAGAGAGAFGIKPTPGGMVQLPNPGTGLGLNLTNPSQPTATPTATADWEAYITNYGFPPDVIAEIRRIFQNNPDVGSAQQLALAYIRGTPWYEQNFPGIKDAIKMGIINNEKDYRQNFNTFNQVYRQYTGQDISPQEYANSLREGITADTAARRFQGKANVAAYGNDWQYLAGAFGAGRLSEADLKAQGEQQAGISTNRGTFLDKALQDAQRRMQRAFEGVLGQGAANLPKQSLSTGGLVDIGR
jgi:hypothetical protein